MNLKDKKIGIWGFGLVGQSAADYLEDKKCTLSVIDQQELPEEKVCWLEDHHIKRYKSTHIKSFLRNNNFIVPSPGINLYDFSKHPQKWLTELDLFYDAWRKKPIVAITGSVGKTTVTHMLSACLAQTGKKVATGGNIGVPMLGFLNEQKKYDLALLEVSSFQLEHCKYFAPDLAIITNFYPNHLDRHLTVQNYLNAKYKMVTHQTDDHHQALLPLKFLCKIAPEHRRKNNLHFFCTEKPSAKLLGEIPEQSTLFYLENNKVIVRNKNKEKTLATISPPKNTFDQNVLITYATLHLLGEQPPATLPDFKLPEHRLEFVATINGVTFYDDSKSTTPASTLAAVEKLSGNPIILLLGGLSKGIDRSDLIKQLKGKVKKIYCFGKEAKKLEQFCLQKDIPCSSFETLEKTFAACTQSAQPGEIILLSPAGASFDLFKNYKERGEQFKKLVGNLLDLHEAA